MRFENRVTIVTGGGSGLGRVLAHRFAAEGAAVVVADVAGERASAVVDEISDSGGRSLSQTTDVTDASDVRAMVETAREAFGPVDILVNNAAKATDADFLSLGEETWDEDVNISLKGPFLCSQTVLADMVQNGSGVIINISSVNGGEEMLGYLDARTDTVTSLVEEVATAASGGGAGLAVLDLCGAEKGFASGHPEGEAAPAIGWQMGIDHAALVDVCHTVSATGYAADPGRLEFDLDAYEALVPDASQLGLVLRPMPPDCQSAENLAAKVALARERGLGRLDFYHYGFCRLEALDWIYQAVAT